MRRFDIQPRRISPQTALKVDLRLAFHRDLASDLARHLAVPEHAHGNFQADGIARYALQQ
jgi:hypothetical protein